MADPVKLTIDGREVKAPAGTLVIDAAKTVGIEIPAFCYYEGLTLQAACRMCLVEVEKMPKLMTACTLPVAEGMIVRTETPQVASSHRPMPYHWSSPVTTPRARRARRFSLDTRRFPSGKTPWVSSSLTYRAMSCGEDQAPPAGLKGATALLIYI